jgi:hypothetical protein
LAEIDLNKLSTGDKVIGASGVLLLIFSLFKWLGIKTPGTEILGETIGGGSVSKSAWGFPLTLIAVLLGVAMVVIVVLKLLDVKLPDLGGVTWGQILFGMGVVAFLLVLFKVVVGPSNWEGFDIPDSVDKTRKIGAFLGLIASAGLAAGGFLKFQEEKAGSSAA